MRHDRFLQDFKYGTANGQDSGWPKSKLGHYPIDGRFDICFDAEKDGVFYEIKSVHRSGKLVIYDWRLEKELGSGVECFYAVMVHEVKGARRDVLNVLRGNVHRILVVPLAEIVAAAKDCPLNLPKPSLKKRNGYNRAGYVRGYRNVPVFRLLNKPVAGLGEV